MNRVMRWHDFGSGREARRSPYRKYGQGERPSHGPKFAPAPALTPDPSPGNGRGEARVPLLPSGEGSGMRDGVAATTAAHFVGRLAHIRDMSCATLRVINPFWLATHTWFIMLGTLSSKWLARTDIATRGKRDGLSYSAPLNRSLGTATKRGHEHEALLHQLRQGTRRRYSLLR